MKQTINWRQAFAEVGLLALGVLLALGADAMMDARRERAEELEYLTALEEDFAVNLAMLRAQSDSAARRRDDGRRLLEVLAGPRGTVEPDTLLALVAESLWIVDVNIVLGTYLDMVNSGDLRLIRSDELRVAMAEFVGMTEDIELLVQGAWRQWYEFEEPFLVEHLEVDQVYSDYRGITIPLRRTAPDLDAAWRREFYNIIAARVVTQQDIVVNMLATAEHVGHVLRLIRESYAPDAQ